MSIESTPIRTPMSEIDPTYHSDILDESETYGYKLNRLTDRIDNESFHYELIVQVKPEFDSIEASIAIRLATIEASKAVAIDYIVASGDINRFSKDDPEENVFNLYAALVKLRVNGQRHELEYEDLQDIVAWVNEKPPVISKSASHQIRLQDTDELLRLHYGHAKKGYGTRKHARKRNHRRPAKMGKNYQQVLARQDDY